MKKSYKLVILILLLSNVFNLKVVGQNSPTATDETITVVEDTPYNITASDFNGFTPGVDDEPLVGIKFVSLPATGTGTLTVNGGGIPLGTIFNFATTNIVYTPEDNDFGDGASAFTFILVDEGRDETNPANTATINISPVNDPPVISNIPDLTINEGGSFTPFGLDEYVTDIDNNVALLNWTTTGQTDLTIDIDEITRVVTVTVPNSDWEGEEAVTFTVSDGDQQDSEEVIFRVNNVNDAPVITGQSTLTTVEETELVITISSITATDIDNTFPDDHTLVIQDGTGYTHVGNTITPNQDVNGSITVNAIVNDGGTVNANSDTYGLTVNITPVNDAPIITGQNTLTTPEETALPITIASIVATDVDNTFPTDHTLIIQDGTGYSRVGNTITPNQDINGDITVNAIINDGGAINANSETFGLTVNVTPVNDAPIITGQQGTLTTPEETALEITIASILATDIDNTFPSDHTLVIQDGTGYTHVGNVITPNEDILGDITVNAVINDGGSENANSATFGLTVNVTSVNDAPVITGQQGTLTTPEETALEITIASILATDVDNTFPTEHTLIIQDGTGYTRAGNTITPNRNINGDITVNAIINDGSAVNANSETFGLTVSVTPVNDAPIITGQQGTLTTPEETSLLITITSILATDVDNAFPGDHTLIIQDGIGYTRAGNTITPNQDVNGNITVNAIINDGGTVNANSTIYGLTVNVTPVNDAPIITSQQGTLTTVEETALEITISSIIATDVDNTFPGDHILVIQDGTGYSRVGNTITPNQDVNGNITVNAIINDGGATNANSETFGLTVYVTPVNDAPIITGQQGTLTTPEETLLEITIASILATDVDNAFPGDHTLIIQDGTGYTRVGNTITPNLNINGDITVNAIINDGGSVNSNSASFGLTVNVTPINDAPVITGQQGTLTTPEETSLEITIASILATDVDNTFPDDHTLIIQNGTGYTRVGNTITPNQDINGNITVNAIINDGGSVNSNSNSFGLTVDITPVNDAPVITDQQGLLSTAEETALEITISSILATDVDNTFPTDHTLIIQDGTSYSHEGNTIIPNQDVNGNITVNAIISDGGSVNSNSNSFGLTVNVTPVNDAPVITGQQGTLITPEETALEITIASLLATDVDNSFPGDHTLIIQDGTSYTHEGNTITPNQDVNGNIIVNAIINDGSSLNFNSNPFGLTVNVTPINDSPALIDIPNYTIDEGQSFATIDLNTFVSDVDNLDSELTWEYSGQTELEVEINSSRIATIAAPNNNWNGAETITFTVSDGEFELNNASTFTVNPINDAPVINSQSNISTQEDIAFTISLTSLNVTDVDNEYPSEHSINIQGGTNYTVENNIITPTLNYNGNLTVPVTISDIGTNNSISNTYNLRVTVQAVNDAPIILSQVNGINTNEDESVVISLTDLEVEDVDNESSDFVLTLYSGDNYSISGNTVIPTSNYFGTLSVDATISDGESENNISNRFAINVLVVSQNDAPVTEDFSVATPENQSITINLIDHISDVDDNLDLSTLAIISEVSNGSVQFTSSTGQVIYTPNSSYFGSDQFTYEICDDNEICSSGVVTITVSNEVPTSEDTDLTIDEDEPIVVNILEIVNDPQNNINSSSLRIITNPENGEGEVLSNGRIRYTPNNNYSGEDELVYEICDADNYCVSAKLNYTINSVNDQPVITGQNNVSLDEDNSITLTLNDLLVTDTDNNYPNDFTLIVQSGSNYTYSGNTITPTLNYNGVLNVNLVVDDQSDENNLSEQYSISINVNAINDKPIISDQASLTTNEDTPIEISVSDLVISDPDNTFPDDYVLVLLPGLNYSTSNNTITPSLNYYGGLNVPIYVSDQADENDRSRIFNLVVQVDAVNDAPVANSINQATPENVDLQISLESLVSDVDGNIDYTTFENIITPQNGSFRVDYSSLILTYTPNTGFSGEDTFNFRFADEAGAQSNIADIAIEVTNQAPNAIDDNISVNEDVDITFNAISNDVDPQDNIDLSTLVIVNYPLNGNASVNNETGEITYDPEGDYFGTDRITYRICDETGYCDEATITITVNSVNDVPIPIADESQTDEDVSVIINVLENDTDIDSDVNGFIVSIHTQPTNGSVSVDATQKQVTYTPNSNYNGMDSFEYTVCDEEGGCSNQTVEITINPINDSPVAEDDESTVTGGSSVAINITENDSDIDNNLDITSVSVISQPKHGSVQIESINGIINYTADEDYSGADILTYRVCDTSGDCDVAEVTINVTPKNVAPVCSNVTINTFDGLTENVNLLDYIIDANGDEVTVLIGDYSELKGVLEESNDGSFVYTSLYGEYCIQEKIVYQGCDGSGECGEAEILFVIEVNDPDGDKIPSFIEGDDDTDNDELPNFNDPDSDNDGIEDIIEAGIIDSCVDKPVDKDDDGIPDYLDTDSDNDFVPDKEEGGDDCDNDGIPDYLDSYDDCAERIDAPETFSPNGDGVNDTFIIPGISDFEGNEIFIYNRWGGEVFKMKNYDNSWDGRSSNSAIGSDELPQGTYYYVVKLGNGSVLKGMVYIKR